MSKFMWILGATCLGATAYVLFSEQLGTAPRYAVDRDGLDEFGQKVGSWGTKSRVTGTGSQLGGKLKQGFGKVTGDDQLQSEGYADEVVGKVKDTAGKAAHAVSDTIADLNR